jgi:hypothetical protein
MVCAAQERDMIRRMLLICAVAVPFGLACGGDKEAPPPKTEPKKKKSNIKKITLTVPPGQQVPCETIFDVEGFAAATELDIGSLKDRSKSNSSMTAVCAFHRAGEPPKDDKQLAEWTKNNRKLGVLPADEYCTVSLNCSVATDEKSLQERCEKDRLNPVGMTEYEDNDSFGHYACVRKTDRPPEDWAYTYRIIDPDTKCLLEVMGGPSVTSEELVQKCTRAGMDQITLDKLKTN